MVHSSERGWSIARWCPCVCTVTLVCVRARVPAASPLGRPCNRRGLARVQRERAEEEDDDDTVDDVRTSPDGRQQQQPPPKTDPSPPRHRRSTPFISDAPLKVGTAWTRHDAVLHLEDPRHVTSCHRTCDVDDDRDEGRSFCRLSSLLPPREERAKEEEEEEQRHAHTPLDTPPARIPHRRPRHPHPRRPQPRPQPPAWRVSKQQAERAQGLALASCLAPMRMRRRRTTTTTIGWGRRR